MTEYIIPIAVYLCAVSLLSIIVTLWDKRVSKIRGKRRVPEKFLLFLSFIGGSFSMYMTMILARHKTKHPKFMIGIPVIMILHCIAAVILYGYLR